MLFLHKKKEVVETRTSTKKKKKRNKQYGEWTLKGRHKLRGKQLD